MWAEPAELQPANSNWMLAFHYQKRWIWHLPFLLPESAHEIVFLWVNYQALLVRNDRQIVKNSCSTKVYFKESSCLSTDLIFKNLHLSYLYMYLNTQWLHWLLTIHDNPVLEWIRTVNTIFLKVSVKIRQTIAKELNTFASWMWIHTKK